MNLTVDKKRVNDHFESKTSLKPRQWWQNMEYLFVIKRDTATSPVGLLNYYKVSEEPVMN